MFELLQIDQWGLIGIMVALFLGGLIKGATGAGLPVIAVPVIASFSDVQTAVVVLVIPNLVVNGLQVYKFRHASPDKKLVRQFAIFGVIGAALGTFVLAWMPATFLSIGIAIIVFCYILLRLLNPSFALSIAQAKRLAPPIGVVGGILQGAIGISAPIAITFTNAIRVDRPAFILMISVFFAGMCLSQFPVQLAFGMVTIGILLAGFLSLVPMLIGLQLGDFVGRRMNPVIFDRVILIMLAVLAIEQIITL